MFTRFGGMPDSRVRGQLARGARIRAILNQPQHAPLRLADEVGLVTAVQNGLLDALPLDAIAGFREGLGDMLDRDAAEAVAALQQNGAVAGAVGAGFYNALTRYAQNFLASRGGTP